MAEKMKPDKLMLDVRQADAAGLSYGRWRFEETERIRKGKEIIKAKVSTNTLTPVWWAMEKEASSWHSSTSS